jgi:predicted dehydrogenase
MFDSYEELCADPTIDIVYVGTKTADHCAHSLLAVAGGKHVLCEKPFTTNAAEARQCYAAAEQKGVMMQEGMWTRYFPAYEHARAALEAGAIGAELDEGGAVFTPHPALVCTGNLRWMTVL